MADKLNDGKAKIFPLVMMKEWHAVCVGRGTLGTLGRLGKMTAANVPGLRREGRRGGAVGGLAGHSWKPMPLHSQQQGNRHLNHLGRVIRE